MSAPPPSAPLPGLPESSPLPPRPQDEQARLSTIVARTTAEAALLVIPAVMLWALPADTAPQARSIAWLWAGGSWLLCLLTLWMRRSYWRDTRALPPPALVARWRRRLPAAALGMGLWWAALAAVSAQVAAFDYSLLTYLVLAGVTASTATFASAVPAAFRGFLVGCWPLSLAALPGAFAERWPGVMVLALLYIGIVWRHGQRNHAFMLEREALQRRTEALAEAYRQASDAAQEASQAKSRFFATASHDLRQPLYALALTTQAAAERNRDGAVTPLLTDMASTVRHIDELLGSLLDLSALDASQAARQRVEIDLLPLLVELHGRYRAEAKARGLQWRLRLPCAPELPAWGDALLLRRAVGNLLHNALRYTSAGGVLLACRRRGASWRVEVWDTGVGVAPAQQAWIFKPFARAEGPWTPGGDGHGIGLAVVQECADKMGGRVTLRSVPGRGSCFALEVPADAPEMPSGPGTSGAVQPTVKAPTAA